MKNISEESIVAYKTDPTTYSIIFFLEVFLFESDFLFFTLDLFLFSSMTNLYNFIMLDLKIVFAVILNKISFTFL